MDLSLKSILLACLFVTSTCQAGNVEDLETRLRAAAESPDTQRLMEYLYHFNHLKGHLEMPKDSKDLMACEVCTSGLNAFLSLFIPPGAIFTPEDFSNAFKNFCKEVHLLSDPACDGIVDNYAPVLEEIYMTQEVNAGVLCAIHLGEQACAGVEDAQLEDWTVEIDGDKPPVEDKVMPEDGMPTQKILHISDIHIDPTYEVGSRVDCDDIGMCCTNSSGVAENGELAAGYWGDYMCDLPVWTLEDIMQHIRDSHDDIDFILLTGDYPAHDMWYQGKDFNLDVANITLSMVLEIFPDVQVLPSLGNHEAFPGNIFATDSDSEYPDQYQMSWLYEGLADLFANWVPMEDLDTFKQGGFYVTTIDSGLKFMSVNSMFCYTMNFWLGLEYRDPLGQLQWLHDELLIAEANGEKVWILSHLPTGNDNCVSTWAREYTKIIERFENTVVNQFYGHTHNDEFKVFYDSTGARATSFGFVTPSVTPLPNTNLAYRIYTVDGVYPETTRRVTDYDTYIGDLLTAGEDETSPMEYSLLYNAKQDLGLENLLPEDFDNLARRMVDDDDLFGMFMLYYNSASYLNYAWTDEDRKDIICQAVTTDRANDSKCNELFGITSTTTTEGSSGSSMMSTTTTAGSSGSSMMTSGSTTMTEEDDTTTSGAGRMSFLFW